MLPDYIEQAEQISTTSKNKNSLWQKLIYFYQERLFSTLSQKDTQIQMKSIFNVQFTDYYINSHNLKKTTKVSQLYARLSIFQLFC